MSHPEKLLGKLNDQERRIWQQIEAARKAGASNEQLSEQKKDAEQIREQATTLRSRLLERF